MLQYFATRDEHPGAIRAESAKCGIGQSYFDDFGGIALQRLLKDLHLAVTIGIEQDCFAVGGPLYGNILAFTQGKA